MPRVSEWPPRSAAPRPPPALCLVRCEGRGICPASAPRLVLLGGKFPPVCGVPAGPAVAQLWPVLTPRAEPARASLPLGNAGWVSKLGFTWPRPYVGVVGPIRVPELVPVAPSAQMLLLTSSSPPVPPVPSQLGHHFLRGPS